MTEQAILNLLLLVFATALGLNVVVWSLVGLARCVSERFTRRRPGETPALTVADVAVVIPAHNEEVALPKCIAALARIIPPGQIFLASDGSRDGTARVARAMGCNVLEIFPNGGKARALEHAIRDNRLAERFQAVLIQDADSEIDGDFFKHALPLFDDPGVVVVAGHVLSRWPDAWRLRPEMLYTAYRTRLYRILQAAFQYGQSWKPVSVSYIAPGFTSMYRTAILDQIDITAPGLVIEDFNMTFEVQRKRLGRIAYTPRARCSSEDPYRFGEYKRQVARWYLGFWQTVRRHGLWPGRFWAALLPLLVELAGISLLLLALPVLVVLEFTIGFEGLAWSMTDLALKPVPPSAVLLTFLAVDYLLTLAVALLDRRPALLVYGLAFPVLRLLDAALFLNAFAKSFSARSDGRWVSPTRHGAGAQPTLSHLK